MSRRWLPDVTLSGPRVKSSGDPYEIVWGPRGAELMSPGGKVKKFELRAAMIAALGLDAGGR